MYRSDAATGGNRRTGGWLAFASNQSPQALFLRKLDTRLIHTSMS